MASWSMVWDTHSVKLHLLFHTLKLCGKVEKLGRVSPTAPWLKDMHFFEESLKITFKHIVSGPAPHLAQKVRSWCGVSEAKPER